MKEIYSKNRVSWIRADKLASVRKFLLQKLLRLSRHLRAMPAIPAVRRLFDHAVQHDRADSHFRHRFIQRCQRASCFIQRKCFRRSDQKYFRLFGGKCILHLSDHAFPSLKKCMVRSIEMSAKTFSQKRIAAGSHVEEIQEPLKV